VDFSSTAANQFLIRAAGGVGIGTANPLAQLAVDGNARIDARGGAYSEGLVVNCPPDMTIPGGYGGIVFHSATRGAALDGGTVKWGVQYNYAPELGVAGGGMALVQNNATTRLYVDATGNVGMGTTNPTNKLHVAGGVSATAFVSTSDRNAKENFTPISAQAVLAKVAALPITQWNFKEMPGQRHMGPMAQDFYAAFGLGGSETTITSVDPDGVALAAIQGLNQKLETELKRRDAENAELKRVVDELKTMVQQLARK
jgi:Chaperone of endosialidase